MIWSQFRQTGHTHGESHYPLTSLLQNCNAMLTNTIQCWAIAMQQVHCNSVHCNTSMQYNATMCHYPLPSFLQNCNAMLTNCNTKHGAFCKMPNKCIWILSNTFEWWLIILFTVHCALCTVRIHTHTFMHPHTHTHKQVAWGTGE